MAEIEISGVDGKRGIEMPCPIDYFPGENKQATRVLFYKDDALVLTWDFLLEDEVRYDISIVISPEFRDNQWMTLLEGVRPGALEKYSRSKVVWVNVTPDVANIENEMVQTLSTMTKNKALTYDTIYSHGSLNKIIHIDADEEST